MANYINLSLDCSPFLDHELDLRVPEDLTIKELMQIVADTYHFDIRIVNPSVRNSQTGEILASTSRIGLIKDGVLLQLENV